MINRLVIARKLAIPDKTSGIQTYVKTLTKFPSYWEYIPQNKNQGVSKSKC